MDESETMTPLSYTGIIIAVTGSVLGIAGAWMMASKDIKVRHFGFTCWLLNSPLIVISLIGIAMGIWEGINAWVFVPLNVIYWGTAVKGWRNTK
jgi:hypothetical protein